MNNCVPHKVTSSRDNLPWFTRSLRRQIRRKQRLYNKVKDKKMNYIGKNLEKPNEMHIVI